MGILLEFIPSLFTVLAFDFLFYVTGSIILRVVSFGLYKSKIHGYEEFKELKTKSSKALTLKYIIGALFYVLAIVVIVMLN
ncbi:hypothetical protein [Flocculibacter collagenilyticus]|uniref:hypothetical protein n=1 Tax=Flocculibacter collagenilyticus TaxID=2744479 RepID=UPI0018F69B35|nr:hypothetical protein [Flocculibacter collagenilyticus]